MALWQACAAGFNYLVNGQVRKKTGSSELFIFHIAGYSVLASASPKNNTVAKLERGHYKNISLSMWSGRELIFKMRFTTCMEKLMNGFYK